MLFTVALSADGGKTLAGGGSKIDAIKAEVLAGCKIGCGVVYFTQ